jgi:hypothetical protein
MKTGHFEIPSFFFIFFGPPLTLSAFLKVKKRMQVHLLTLIALLGCLQTASAMPFRIKLGTEGLTFHVYLFSNNSKDVVHHYNREEDSGQSHVAELGEIRNPLLRRMQNSDPSTMPYTGYGRTSQTTTSLPYPIYGRHSGEKPAPSMYL